MTRKRMFLIMMSGIVCVFIVSCKAKTDRWVIYGTSNDGGQKYYDKQTITTVSPKVIRVSDKLIVPKEGIDKIIERRKESNLPIDGWDKLESVVTLRELDCANNTNKMIKIEDYNDRGKKIYESDYQNSKAEPIEPGSMVEKLFNTVCTK
jgi:endo-alpha-1,4-polygalactosaminidase (GH114 family)